METGVSPARQLRTQYRHELRTLTYVTLDQANGGIIRNITHEGIGAQLVAAVRPRQQLRVRFELRYPRLRVETRGEVVWATFSGQCGIRFLGLSPRLARQVNEWILGNLLEGADIHASSHPDSHADSSDDEMRQQGLLASVPELRRGMHEFVLPDENPADPEAPAPGLMISPMPVKVIELPSKPDLRKAEFNTALLRPSEKLSEVPKAESHLYSTLHDEDLDWLSRPLSARGLAWTVNSLAVVAGLLLFALVFLFVTRELPKWPIALTGAAAVFIAAFYWAFFRWFGGASPGARLARLAGYQFDDDSEETEKPEASPLQVR
jgi:PilZ domain